MGRASLWTVVGCCGWLLWLAGGAPAEGKQPETRLTVAEARMQARLLHETYVATLQAMHRRYFRDDAKQPVPSRVMEEVFADISVRFNVKARWFAVNAQVMTLEHEPRDEFEREAGRRFVAGQEEHEQVENGVYRRAGAIALFSSCVKCHAPAPMRPDVARYAGLTISVPVSTP